MRTRSCVNFSISARAFSQSGWRLWANAAEANNRRATIFRNMAREGITRKSTDVIREEDVHATKNLCFALALYTIRLSIGSPDANLTTSRDPLSIRRPAQ